MNNKKKYWLSIISLALVLVLGITAVGVIIAALSANIGGSFKVTYTAKHVEAKVTGLKFNDLNPEDAVPFGEVTFSNSDSEASKSLPNIDLEMIDDGYGTYQNFVVYQIENTGQNGFSVSATVSGIDENSNIQVSYLVTDSSFSLLYGQAIGNDISDIYLRPSENILILVGFFIIDDTKDTNVSGAFNFTLDGLAEEPLMMGAKLNAEIKGGNGATYETEDSSVQSITFDKYTSEGKYEVSGVDKITGIEGVDVGGGAMLYRAPNADKFDVYILSNETIYPRSFSDNMFYELNELQKIEFNNFDTSKVTSMMSMFYNCSQLKSITGIKDFNTQNVTDMSNMFSGCENLTSLDLSGWKTDKVISMSSMFSLCYKLESITGIEDFNTQNVTSMVNMFWGSDTLTSLDLSSWDTSNVTDMAWMFFGCSSLTSLNLSGFKTDKVTDMSCMFADCSQLQSIPGIKDFNTQNVTNMESMFQRSSLISLDLNDWNTSNVTNMESIFQSCSSLISLDLSGWHTSNVTNMSNMFISCTELQTIYVGEGWNTQNVSNSSSMFAFCNSLVGGNAANPTHYDSRHTNKEYARVDGENGLPGYLTRKSN